MSDGIKTQVEEELERSADDVPDDVVNEWLKSHGFTAMGETRNGRALVRFLMRRTAAHVAGPVVIEQRGIIDGLRKERDVARVVTFNPVIDEHTPKLVRVLAGKPLTDAVESLMSGYAALVHSDGMRQAQPVNQDEPKQNTDIAGWQPIGNMRDGTLALTDGGELYVLIPWSTVANEREPEFRAGVMIAPNAVTCAGHACVVSNSRMARVIAAGSVEHQEIVRKDRMPPEQRDGAAHIGVASIGQPVAQTVRTSAQSGLADALTRIRLDLGAETERTITAMTIDQWFMENGGEPVPEKMRPLMAGFCRFVARTAAADMIAARDQRIVEIEQTNATAQQTIKRLAEDADRLAVELSQAKRAAALLDSVKNQLRAGGWETDTPGNDERIANTVGLLVDAHTDRDKLRAAHDALWQDIRQLVGPISPDVHDEKRNEAYLTELRRLVFGGRGKLDASEKDVLNAHDALTKAGIADQGLTLAVRIQAVIDERADILRVLKEAGASDKSLADMVKSASIAMRKLKEIRTAINARDDDDTMTAIQRIYDRKDAAFAALYQYIRTTVGAFDVTNADRAMATKEDAANRPEVREYYAERRALLRVVGEQAKDLKDIRSMVVGAGISLDDGIVATVKRMVHLRAHNLALVEQCQREQHEIRDILSKAGHRVDTHADLLNALHALCVDEQIADESSDAAEDQAPPEHNWKDACWSGSHRLDIHVALPLLRGLSAIIAEPMAGGPPSIQTRRQRIIRMYRAVLVLGSTHGVFLDEHANVDLTDDGPALDA